MSILDGLASLESTLVKKTKLTYHPVTKIKSTIMLVLAEQWKHTIKYSTSGINHKKKQSYTKQQSTLIMVQVIFAVKTHNYNACKA